MLSLMLLPFLVAGDGAIAGGQCWRLQTPFPACGGCADVFNCGNCRGTGAGSCSAILYQVCAKQHPVVPAVNGVTVYQDTVPCFKNYLCGLPPGCAGAACTASGIQQGASEDTAIIVMVGFPCP